MNVEKTLFVSVLLLWNVMSHVAPVFRSWLAPKFQFHVFVLTFVAPLKALWAGVLLEFLLNWPVSSGS